MQNDVEDFLLQQELPTLVSIEQNKEIIRIPRVEEVKVVVMGLNRNSSGGQDGMTGAFYRDTQDIIGKDTHNMVVGFF